MSDWIGCGESRQDLRSVEMSCESTDAHGGSPQSAASAASAQVLKPIVAAVKGTSLASYSGKCLYILFTDINVIYVFSSCLSFHQLSYLLTGINTLC